MAFQYKDLVSNVLPHARAGAPGADDLEPWLLCPESTAPSPPGCPESTRHHPECPDDSKQRPGDTQCHDGTERCPDDTCVFTIRTPPDPAQRQAGDVALLQEQLQRALEHGL